MSGLNCEGCKENYPYAEANQPNGKLVCYGCKANGFVYNDSTYNWSETLSQMLNSMEIKRLEYFKENMIYQNRGVMKTQAMIDFGKREGLKFVILPVVSKEDYLDWCDTVKE